MGKGDFVGTTRHVHKPEPRRKQVQRALGIFMGTALVGVALEIFLIPNRIIDGGVVGLSIMAAHLSRLPVGLFLFVLNLPFLWMGYRQIGRSFSLTTLVAVTLMSLFTSALHPVPKLTGDLLLAAVFGGAILGLGVGMVIRHGGCLDGTEVVAIMLTRRLPFSVGEIVMFFNLFILGGASLVFGWDRAMYSLLAYFVAFRAIDTAVQGLDGSKAAMIVSRMPDKVREAIMRQLGRGVTELEGKGGFTGASRSVLYTVVSRLELAKLKSIVLEVDGDAFVAIQDVHEVMGRRYRKEAPH